MSLLDLSVADQAARGRELRAAVSRSSHGRWAGPSSPRDPVALLEEQAQTRLPELVPIRYGRMLASPFAFFRGSAYLMASDLAEEPRTGLDVQLCGDAHLSNFGVFAAPDRRLVFSLNDFDETLPGPFEWDLKRLVTSFAVAGRNRGFLAHRRAAINQACGRAYRQAMRHCSRMGALDLWYLRQDVDEQVSRWVHQLSAKRVKRFERNIAKTRAKTSLRAFDKLTEIVKGEARIVSDPPSVVPVEELAGDAGADAINEAMRAVIDSYRGSLAADRRRLLERFSYVHAARKVVGVGSVGTRAWIMLLTGRDARDPLFLQFKEAQPSVLARFLPSGNFSNQGRRVVEGQRLAQEANDILLGWISFSGLDGVERDYYVRQLWDQKGAALIDAMNPTVMKHYAELCGGTLARAHARSGDPVAIAAYMGAGEKLDKALARFGEAYADQNERDYAVLREAVAAGSIEAQEGV